MAKCLIMKWTKTVFFFFHHVYAYDAKLRKKAVKRAEPGKPGEGQHKVAAMGGREGGGDENKIFIKPFSGKFLYLGLLNWLKMHLKLQRVIKLVVLYSLQMTQISKAQAIMSLISGMKLAIIAQDENKRVQIWHNPFCLSFTK